MQICYSRYEKTFDNLDTYEVMGWLKDFLLASGLRDPYSNPDPGRGKSQQELYQALLKALLEHHRVPPQTGPSRPLVHRTRRRVSRCRPSDNWPSGSQAKDICT